MKWSETCFKCKFYFLESQLYSKTVNKSNMKVSITIAVYRYFSFIFRTCFSVCFLQALGYLNSNSDWVIYFNNYHVSAWGYEMLLSPCDVRFMLVLFCLSYYWNIKKRYFNRHFCYASYHTQRVYFYYKLFVIRYKDWQKRNIKSQPLFQKRQIIWIFHKWKCAKHLEFHSLRVMNCVL